MPTVADATTFVDLFCGAGGLSLGLTQAGWQPMLAVDLWGEAVETHAKNLPGHPVISDDIHALTAARLRRLIDDSPDWIVGGPPCQGYSTVGRRDRSDPRNQMFREFMRVVSLLKPHGFVLENVLGLRDMSFVNEVRSAFQRLGYTVVPMVLTAADYGVPQLRRRVLFVGHRDRGVFQGPERTHAPVEYVTVFDAISDLPVVTPGETVTAYTRQARNRYQRRLRADSRVLQGHTVSAHPPHLVEAISHIPDGGNRNSIPDHLQPSSGFHNSYSRLASWMPAVAVTSNMRVRGFKGSPTPFTLLAASSARDCKSQMQFLRFLPGRLARRSTTPLDGPRDPCRSSCVGSGQDLLRRYSPCEYRWPFYGLGP
jgi:DNA (cytosine-5)-methyltransferase 1